MKDRKDFDITWNNNKKENAEDNRRRFTGWKGSSWWENGIPNPGTLRVVKIGGVSTIYFRK